MLRRQKPEAVATPQWEYDIFLSCKDEAIIKSFTSSLLHKLRHQGIKVFVDDQDLEEGGQITSPQLLTKHVIVVLSLDYASSPWHLDRLSKILECMEDMNGRILPVFYGVNPSDVRKQNGSFEETFHMYEERFKEDLAKVQRWRAALSKLSNIVGWTSQGRKNEELIKEIVETVWSKLHLTLDLQEKAHPTGSRKKEGTFERTFLLTNLCLEILSAAFDQASSPSKPHYALFGMLLAIAAVLTCIWELIHKGTEERIVLKRSGKLWWFYYPHPRNNTPFGTLPDFYGLIGGISQCSCSTIQYVYFHQHADNPIKLSVLPAIFLMCLAGSRLNRNQNH